MNVYCERTIAAAMQLVITQMALLFVLVTLAFLEMVYLVWVGIATEQELKHNFNGQNAIQFQIDTLIKTRFYISLRNLQTWMNVQIWQRMTVMRIQHV